jgi:hypothetical protein
MKCVLLSLLVLLSPVAGLAQPMQVVRATRLAQNPLITVDTSVSLGGNVNSPTVIRVPDWVGRPLGRYYMYFANHKGEFIHLAYADAVTGPWKVFEPGVLHVRDTAFFRDAERSRGLPDSRRLEATVQRPVLTLDSPGWVAC